MSKAGMLLSQVNCILYLFYQNVGLTWRQHCARHRQHCNLPLIIAASQVAFLWKWNNDVIALIN